MGKDQRTRWEGVDDKKRCGRVESRWQMEGGTDNRVREVDARSLGFGLGKDVELAAIGDGDYTLQITLEFRSVPMGPVEQEGAHLHPVSACLKP